MIDYKDKITAKCPYCKEEILIELITAIDHKLELTEHRTQFKRVEEPKISGDHYEP